MASVFLVFSTIDDQSEAERLSRRLVDERLVACVNILSGLTSTYRWEGEIRQDAEYLMILKTSGERLDEAQKRLAELHPYDVPEVVAVPVAGGHEPYLEWIASET